jgi:hypothetical protein
MRQAYAEEQGTHLEHLCASQWSSLGILTTLRNERPDNLTLMSGRNCSLLQSVKTCTGAHLLFHLTGTRGRAIAQAVSRWLPTAAARVRAWVWSCGICGQSGAGAGFLRVLRFTLPIFIPPIAPQSPSSIIWGLYNRPEVAAVPSGLSPTLLIIIIKKRVPGAFFQEIKFPGRKLITYFELVPIINKASLLPAMSSLSAV